MAKARKCDRCGNFYIEDNHEPEFSVQIFNPNESDFNKKFFWADICPSCAKELKEWWEAKRDQDTRCHQGHDKNQNSPEMKITASESPDSGL